MKNQALRSIAYLALMLGIMSSAVAGEREPDAQRRTVSAAGLDLTRLPDAELLYARLRAAAHSVCRAQQAVWDVKRVTHKRRCVERVVEDAVAGIGEPLLTAVHHRAGERVAKR
jgi:UrcA family protein